MKNVDILIHNDVSNHTPTSFLDRHANVAESTQTRQSVHTDGPNDGGNVVDPS